MNRRQRSFERARLELFRAHGVDLETRRVKDREGRTTHALDTGGSGRPLLMVHGGGSQAAEWAPLAGEFAEDRRLMLVDRPGCGLSYSVDYRGRDLRRCASDWLTDLVDALEVESIDLVASSVGAFFALSYLLSVDRPQRVRRLVLAGAPFGMIRSIPFPVRLMGLRGVNRLLCFWAGSLDAEMVRDVYRRRLVVDPGRLSESYLEVMARGANLPGAKIGWRSLLEECVDLRGLRSDYLLRDELPSIEVPIRFLWGDADAYAPSGTGRDVAARTPTAEFETVADAGHLPWLDRPAECAGAIRSFLGPTDSNRPVEDRDAPTTSASSSPQPVEADRSDGPSRDRR